MSSSAPIKVSVGLPDSVLSEKPSLALKTQIAGYIARALAIFGVSELKVYHDSKYGAKGDMEVLELILRYVLTPPYLRKHVFGIRKELKYVGIMPPVTIPSHTVEREDKVRFGYVFRQQGKLFVHAGLSKPVELVGYSGATGEVIPVEIIELKGEKKARPAKFTGYSGFLIKKYHSVEQLLNEVERGSFVIFTSREGEPVSKVYAELAKSIRSSGSVLVLFGGPKAGLEDMLKEEARRSGIWLNTVEGQHVKTVRTEEALIITLGILNLLSRLEV